MLSSVFEQWHRGLRAALTAVGDDTVLVHVQIASTGAATERHIALRDHAILPALTHVVK
jgi:hypothetical protein